jgi:hypothetical protein
MPILGMEKAFILLPNLDGYVVPTNIISGLGSRMSMSPYTNEEWETLPHVILTAYTD